MKKISESVNDVLTLLPRNRIAEMKSMSFILFYLFFASSRLCVRHNLEVSILKKRYFEGFKFYSEVKFGQKGKIEGNDNLWPNLTYRMIEPCI